MGKSLVYTLILKMKTITINKISWHLIWIFGLLEMITVPLVVLLPKVFSIGVKSPLEGALVGFLGVLVLFLIINKVLFKLRINVFYHPLISISALTSAIWSMIILALIFWIQELVSLINIPNLIIKQALAGFLSVSGAVALTLILYFLITRLIPLSSIWLKTKGAKYTISSISIIILALMGGLYEAIALPIILIWQKADNNVALTAMITGTAGGVAGSLIVVLVYNFQKLMKIKMKIKVINQ